LRRTIGILLLLTVLLSAFATGCASEPALPVESTPPEPLSPEDFIAQNLSALNVIRNLDDLSGYSLLDPFLEDNEIFLTGEIHGTHFNSILTLQFLKYLHQTAGVRYYLLETDHGTAGLWNIYLDTGDESILERIMKHLKGSPAYTEDTVALYRGIREYNLTLPEEERIVLVGVDISHRVGVAMWYLSMLLPNETPPHEIADAIESIIEAANADTSPKDWSAGPRLLEEIEKNRAVFERYLGGHLSEFEFVVRNISQAHDSYGARETEGDSAFYKTRDRYMYENFLWQYQRLPKGKYYGHFGLGHIYMKPGLLWFASHLNGSDSPVEGKTLSIAFLYWDCYLNLSSFGDRASSPYQMETLPGYLKHRPNISATLYRLVGPGSPFEAGPMPYLVWLPDRQCPTTDFFQFAVLIRGSPASETYVEKFPGPR
jgi:hypothetical protein